MLDVSGLQAYYGRAHILHDVAFSAAAGEVLVLLGRNGAGKSTTFKAVMGLVPPAAGRVLFAGVDVAGWEPHRIARAGLGYVPEERRIFTDLTVMENLEVGRSAAAGRRGLDAGAAVPAVPEPRRHAGPPRRPDERRRAADAHHRPHPDGQPAPGAAGRAEARAWPP